MPANRRRYLPALLVALLAPLGVLTFAPAGAAVTPGSDPTCGTGSPVTATHGEANGVVFAALKTGFRAVVAWTSATEENASLRYSLDGGAQVTVTETTPRRHHVFVLDALPQGRSLCFAALSAAGAQVAPPQALLLANAMTAYDAGDGAYTVNLLLVANENPRSRHLLEAGVDLFAQRLHDMTDGHLRAGRILVLYADPEHHNTGTYSCAYPGAVVLGDRLADTPTCDRTVDAMFGHDSCAGGAACAERDGIQKPGSFVMMNSLFQASPVSGDVVWDATEVGAVLTHEFGHYGFGAIDLYTSGPDCWDEAKGISVMGGNRAATELDDAVNRCPNEARVADYVPSWTNLRARFPNVPDRNGSIDEGPHGGGSEYHRHVYVFSAAVEDAPVPQDDAGSGRDAGSVANTAVPVVAGPIYAGALPALVDPSDVYRVDAPAGTTVHVHVTPAGACPTATDQHGDRVPASSTCLLAIPQARTTFTAPGGPLYLDLGLGTGAEYRFVLGLNAAPTLPNR